MRDRSMRSGMELAREIKLTDWSMAGNLSNRSAGVQIPRDICTSLKCYLYSAKCSWIIIIGIGLLTRNWSIVSWVMIMTLHFVLRNRLEIKSKFTSSSAACRLRKTAFLWLGDRSMAFPLRDNDTLGLGGFPHSMEYLHYNFAFSETAGGPLMRETIEIVDI